METHDVRKIIFYREVSEDLKKDLERYHAETIDNDNKYIDNLEIVKKYLKGNSNKQVLMGETHSVLFVGEMLQVKFIVICRVLILR